MIKAIVFDLDDTLISEEDYINSGYKHISNILSPKFKVKKEEIMENLTGLFKESAQNVFNRLFDMYNIDYSREMILDLVNEYRGHSPQIKFYDDVIPCLKALNKLDVSTGIITDGFANAQRQKLNSIKAIDYFQKIVVTDELGRDYWKPHPKPFEIIKTALGVEFNEMIYVGDNPTKDFYISSTFPIKTVRIIRKNSVYRNAAYYKGIKEDVEINSLDELLKLI